MFRGAISRQTIELYDKDICGEGGEAVVYKYNNYAVKILKPHALGKLTRVIPMLSVSRDLPSNVLGPIDIVHSNNNPVGFVSRFAKGQDLNLLSRPNWKQRNNLDNNFVQELFGDIFTTVNRLHTKNVVIGDFNYNNLLFSPLTKDSFFLDVDSMTFTVNGTTYPCTAIHPWFFDPTMTALLQEFKRISSIPGEPLKITTNPNFTENTDWYAFNVLLFMSLFCIHPYKGTHRTLSTEFQRMEARHFVFENDVVVPKSLIPKDAVDDDLMHHFFKVFGKEDLRIIFPIHLLKEWRRCPSCNIEYNKYYCPVCSKGITKPVVVSEVAAGCKSTIIFSTKGRIINSTYQDRLRYIYSEDNVLKMDGQDIAKGTMSPSVRLSIQLNRVWLGEGHRLVGINPNKVYNSIGKMGQLPMFDSNSSHVYIMEGDFLCEDDNLLIGQALENRTWFKVGERIGFGFYKVGMGIFPFMWRVGERGLIPLRNMPSPNGKLLDMTCYFFSDKYILFAASTEVNGSIHTELHLLNTDSYELVGSIKGEASSIGVLNSIYGKALLGNRIISTTDNGIQMIVPLPGNKDLSTKISMISGTENFVKAGDELYIESPTSVYVVSTQEVRNLTFY